MNSTDTTAVGAYNPGVNCGPPVAETKFDYLPGIANRKEHASFPEPEVALIFKQNEFDEPNLEDIENSLKDALVQVSDAQFLPIKIFCWQILIGQTGNQSQ